MTRLARMRALALACAGLALASAACSTAEPPPDEARPTTVEQRAQAALEPLKRKLMAELTGALAEGPPVHALEVCSVRAPEIAAAVAAADATGTLALGRTSHRLRNPQNAPEPWMQPLLAAYLADPADRAPRTVEIDDRTTGYVEPITVQEACLPCHGTSIDPAVRRALDERYPDDRATGFAAGDFRGMFWVKLSR